MILSMLGTGTVVAMLVYMMQVVCVSLGLFGKSVILILSGISGLSGGISIDNIGDAAVNSIRDVVFNRSTFTTASFFYNKNGFKMGLDDSSIDFSNGVAPQIFGQVTNFYYIMRNISIAALLFILLYIGIRMAISTVASDEAKYKKMLGNWAVSMALVFVLQFIMMATLYVNNTLVSILYKFSGDSVFWDYTKLATEGLVPVHGLGEAIVFVMTVGMELTFILMYVKRIITLAFLIVIAPLITITYSIDRIGDNKSQALDTWLKEFMFTVLIQPFHCIIYIVLIQTAVKAMSGIEGVGMGVIYIIMLKFMKEAEDIVRKIFGIRSDSMPGFKGMGVIALGFMGKLGSAGSKSGSGSGKGGNKYKDVPDMKANQKQLQLSNQGANQGTKQGANPPPAQPTPQQQSQEQSKLSKAMSDYGDKVEGIVERMGGGRGLLTKGASMGAKLAGFGLGLGMTGELDQAIGFSAIAGNQAEKIDGALQDVSYRKQLDENEKVYKDEVTRYIENGITANEFNDFEDGMKQVEEFRKKLSAGELDKKAFTPEQDRLARVIDDMTDTIDFGDEIPDADKYLKKLAYDIQDEYNKTH